MGERKALKKRARKTLQYHYFKAVIVVFISTILISGGYFYVTEKIMTKENGTVIVEKVINQKENKKSNAEIVNDLIENTKKGIQPKETKKTKFQRGVLAVFFNEITASDSIVFGILNAFNQFIFQGKVSVLIILLGGVVFSFLYFFFIRNPIIIGRNRFFLERRKYQSTSTEKLLFAYRTKSALHTSSILLVKAIYELLWSLTIVGGFIKHYTYLMIPYLLAENPDMNRKQAFSLSKEMMKGEKWNVFKLDLSFLGWTILGVLTFNLSNIFFFHLYHEATVTEVYMMLRAKAKKEKLPLVELMNDKALEGEVIAGKYPEESYKTELSKSRKWLKIDYEHNYSLSMLILFFFTFAFIGWIWEVSLYLFSHGSFINRGTMFGPWLPIYGWGGVLILILIKPFRKKPLLVFFLIMLLCGVIEYGTAWYLETFKHMKWWDYSGYFLNLNGRICLEGLLVFGLGGCAFLYVLAPLLDNLYQKIKKPLRHAICIILLFLYGIDLVYSHYHPNTGEGITDYEPLIEEKETP